MLYKLPFPLNLTAWGRDFLAKPYQDLWDWLVPWVGKHLLGLSIRIQTSGSGDKTYNYVQLLCFLIIAVAVTVVWTALDRKPACTKGCGPTSGSRSPRPAQHQKV